MNYSVPLEQLLPNVLHTFVSESVQLPELWIGAPSLDSRRVVKKGLFLSLSQDQVLREKYLNQALQNGAQYVLYDQQFALTEGELSLLKQFQVESCAIADLSDKAGDIAAAFYGYPTDAMSVIAVTGTNGKTTVTQLIAQALEGLGLSCGVIGTLGTGRLGQLIETGMTTPDPVSLQAQFAELQAQGCQYVAIEASSHALSQGRLNGTKIEIAVLTNFTRDHLDYHQTMEAYAEAKLALFQFKSLKQVVLNAEQALTEKIRAVLAADIEVKTYSKVSEESISASNIQCEPEGIRFDAKIGNWQSTISTPLLGLFNVDNILATLAVLEALGFSAEKIKKAMTYCQAIDGRMQRYAHQHTPTIVIDYAHTPDALEKALMSLRAHLSDESLLWCVFGCGGDRDKGKRSLMGKIAELNADRVVITDDNPRTEDHFSIVNDILAGCEHPEAIYVEHDRRRAIAYAVEHADRCDIILVAGKGHETYQEINHVKQPFSDREVVMSVLESYPCGPVSLAGGM